MFWDGPDHEFSYRPTDILEAPKTGNNVHPTQKPVSVLQQIIAPNVAGDILDPFAGSGSTLMAAKLCGRRSVGIEINEAFCESMARTLDQRVLPGFGEGVGF